MLYLVATPIGNLGDITLRAIETLKNVDVIASEDTRRTGILLKHLEIKTRQISYHEHNEPAACRKILSLLAEGKDVAVVSDAGTPGVSDPGFTILWEAVTAGFEVTMIPGASAFVTALVLSGMPSSSFTFRGFAPKKPGKRRKFLQLDADSPHTLIFYESPYRVKKFLIDAMEVFGNRYAALAKELTKLHETIIRGRISQILDDLPEKLKGEYVIVIAGAEKTDSSEKSQI